MKYAKYILILALLAASGACTNDFEDYNTNPNKQSEGSVAPIALLEPLIYSSTNSYSSYMLSIANEISQVTVAKSTPRREHCYNLADGNFKAIWNLGYKWAGNAKHMYDLAVAQNQPNFQAIGLTLKVYNMSILTDMFGSIAYREALKNAILGTKELVGTQGIFNFKPEDRYGSDERAVVIVRLEKGKWVLVK